MKITSEITKKDIILYNLLLLPRLRSTYTTILFIALMVMLYILATRGMPNKLENWLILLFSGIAGGFVAIIVGTIFHFFTVVTAKNSNGVLGIHHYDFNNEGFIEKTKVNESITKWEGIENIRTVGPYLFVQIAAHLFHIIPKRSFNNESDFTEYRNSMIEHWKNNA